MEMKFSEELFELIKTNSTLIIEGENNYHFLPFVFKEKDDNTFEVIPINKCSKPILEYYNEIIKIDTNKI
jgi:hypothetical protein